MAKKYFPKALSVGLSLALCASLVAPSFAATFTDLQNVISGNGEYTGSEITREDNTITLNGDVDRNDGEGSITVNAENITLNLNGYTINGQDKGGAVFEIASGSLTIQDIKDENDARDTTGTITGGTDSGIKVMTGGSLTLESGEISGNDRNQVYPPSNGSFSGGGGVNIQGGEFTMTGGKITGNSTKHNGAGVNVYNGTFTMSGGEISENTNYGGRDAQWGDAVSVIGENSTFTMSDGALIDGTIFVKQGGTLEAEGFSGITTPEGEFSNSFTNDKGDDAGLLVAENARNEEYWANLENNNTGTGNTTETTDPVITDEPEVEIEDVAVPLAAGPVTCAEFIDYLWRHEDEPEADLVVEHEYAEAISWALSIEIIDAETFEADELVTVVAVRDILANFAAYADMDVNVYTLTTLTGDEDEAVLNCDEVLAEFFGE